ncbi:MAG: Rid family hydrolase, partial [Candidatus Omnitrophica bacterium]|nr:Rid family hydrolase [Candidatus Omnitrophota bacterium]
YKKLLEKLNLPLDSCVFRRFFFSDLANQYQSIKTHSLLNKAQNNCAISLISQPPGPDAKIALWAYHIFDKKTLNFIDNGLARGKLIHFWDTNITCPEEKTVYQQTEGVLLKYKDICEKRKMRLSENLIRTWFFVQDIDTNYKEFVEARKKVFAENGLTSETHFVASTGVEGTCDDIRARISMDAYSIGGIEQKQVRFLMVPEYISPAYAYGVTFERGTVIHYSDRRHVLISGTASINNKGEIMHPGDLINQFNHTLNNIEILLRQAGANFENVCVFIVYVRDITDAGFIRQEMKKRFGNIPFLVIWSKVCRPGWLVEIECQAVRGQNNNDFFAF